MDQEHVIEQLDAYAIGALEAPEADGIERHVADCVSCWNELGRAQEAASLLALSVPMHEAPARLGERIISTAQRETSPIPVRTEGRGFFARLGLGWPAAAGAMGMASVALIAFGMYTQNQVNDLEDENAQLSSQLQASTFALEQELASTQAQVEEQEILLAVSSDEQAQEFEVAPRSGDVGNAQYTYSPNGKQGVVECYGLDPLPPGMLYQLWVVSEDGAHPMATFLPQDGECLVTMSLGYLESPPTGIGVTTELIPGGLDEPEGEWVLYSELPTD
jgi:hypothetical protein